MSIIDEFKGEKNRNLIIQASNKMLLDKYNLSLRTDLLISIINTIIASMSKDAILMNNTIKLMELNTITLAKMKDYVIKNIDNINAANAANAANANIDITERNEGSERNESNIVNNDIAISTNLLQAVQLPQAAQAVQAVQNYNEDYGYNKTDVLTNEELLIRVKEYEHKRIISNTIFANIENNIDISSTANAANAANTANTANTANANIIPEIMEKVLTSINTNTNTEINKKTLIINSFSRDWINNPNRNKLTFTINIDLQSNIIEPLKILFPKYVKELTPYIILVITDNHKTFKYTFLYSKASGKWDIWKLVNNDNNINNCINLTNKSWKIKFLDYLNNDLNLGNDDIKISQINDYKMSTYDNNNINVETNIDNILMSYNDPNNLTKDNIADTKLNMYEINIDYSNLLEYDEYKLDIISKYDYMQLKTYSNKYVNIKVIDVNNDMGKIIILNETKLMKEDFINSSLLNYGAQYSIILTYYPRRTVMNVNH
jgi:hypothetical protein